MREPSGDWMLSTADALGGRWAANLFGAVILFPLTVALVIIQESATEHSAPAFIAVTAVVQFIAGSLPVIAVVVARRDRTSRFPVAASFTLWGTTGLFRAISGGIMAERFLGANPEYLERMLFWLPLALVGMPAFVYSIAQFEHRRSLIGTLDSETRALDAERERHRHASEHLRSRLIATVQETVTPVIAEIRRSLAAIAHGVSPELVRTISARIVAVADDAARIIADAESPTTAMPEAERQSRIARAIYLDSRSPTTTAVLTVALLGPLALLLAFSIGDTDSWATVPLAISFAIVIVSCTTFLGFMLGVARANAQVSAEITAVRTERVRIATAADAHDALIRDRVTTILHGPLQGRLSACVMALNFHAAERGINDPDRTAYITAAVLEHLDAAAVDLDALADRIT
jgi:hypothetical protein